MPLGVCYYPEHWPEEFWASDARKMREAGLQFVRIGEFAWALMEPAAGEYAWDWLDRAITTLAAEGLQIVLGTPTATPPAWLTAAEPDVLRVGADGRRLAHGGRRQACLANGRYRELSRGIVTALAERYGQHPAVAAWQIDNEIGNHGSARCYCAACRTAFQAWLSGKYGSLAALNEAWGAVFWSQTYSEWTQIPLPADPVGGGHNPSLVLDYRRWASTVQVEYCRTQAAILREHSPNRTILTNIAPGDDEINWFDLAAEVDTIAWDNYPHGFADWQAVSLFHDHMRGLKRQPFWVMEQQPGPINWTATNQPVPPNQVRVWSYQDAAHGAESVLYFRWRACWLGQEQYHSGLLDHASRPARGYGEAQTVAREWAEHGQPVAAPRRVALLVCYDDLWAQQLDPHAQGWNYWQLAQTIHHSLADHGIGVDVIRRGSDLSGYQLVVAVAPMLADAAEADHWRDWVAAGGTLVATPRTFTKRPDNRTVAVPFPADLGDLFGAEVAEWSALHPASPWRVAFNDGDQTLAAPLWAEVLRPTLANPIARWSDCYAAGEPAITACTYGKGLAVYSGAYPTAELLASLWPKLLPNVARQPQDVERIELTDGVLLLNHSEHAATVPFPGEWRDKLSNETGSDSCILLGLAVRWLAK